MTDINKLCQYCLNEADMSEETCAVCGQDPNRVPERSSRCLPQYTILAGRYLIGRVLGEGGFGITYLALDLIREERVAVKEYFPVELASRDTKKAQDNEISIRSGEAAIHFNNGMRRFESEALTLRKLEMLPGIVSVLDFFTENNTAYLVMEYIEGGNLKNYLKNYIEKNGHAIPCEEAFGMMRPVLNSLQKVHEAGIIHRDISPENILLDKNGDLVLIDFGSAKTNLASRENRSMTVMVKHGYAPEEQYRTHGDQGPWTDIYAACATLYHMISGILPEDAIERLIGDRMKSLKELELTPPMPEGYSDIIEKGMQIRGKNRYQSVEEMLADVDAAEEAIAEERRKAEEERRRAEEEQRKAEEAARLEAERRAAEEARREEEKKKAEAAKRQEAETRAAEEKKARHAEYKAAEETAKSKRAGKNTGYIIAGIIVLAALLILPGALRTVLENREKEKQYMHQLEAFSQEVFPECNFSASIDCGIDGVIDVRQEGYTNTKEVFGYVISAESEGYSGPVVVFAAFSNDGKIKQIRIDSSKEVQGTRISEPEFISNFTGKNTEGRYFETDASAGVNVVSGATISSEAAVTAINLTIQAFNSEAVRKVVEKEIDGEWVIVSDSSSAEGDLLLQAQECEEQEQWLEAAIAYGKLAELSRSSGDSALAIEYANYSVQLWQQYGACNDIDYRTQRIAAINEDGTVKVLCSPEGAADFSDVENWENIVSLIFKKMGGELYGLKADGTIVCNDFQCEKFAKLTDVIGLASVVNGYVAALCTNGTVYFDKEINGEMYMIDDPAWHDIRYIAGGYECIMGVREDGVILESYLPPSGDRAYTVTETVEISDYTNETIKKITNDGAIMLILNDQGTVHLQPDPIEEQGHSGYFWMTDEDVERIRTLTDIVDIEAALLLHENGTVEAFGWAWHGAQGWKDVSDICWSDDHYFAVLNDGTIKYYDPDMSERDYASSYSLTYCEEQGLEREEDLSPVELMDALGLDPLGLLEMYGIDPSENNYSDAGLAEAVYWDGLRTRIR